MRLAQVFANLLNNAAKYTDPGGRISIAAQARRGTMALVTVSDTGVGMPAESLSRVFEMFAQADSRDRRARSGLGIGLSLARSLVEMHGGSLKAASEGKGKGSSSSSVCRSTAAGAPAPPTSPPSRRGFANRSAFWSSTTIGMRPTPWPTCCR